VRPSQVYVSTFGSFRLNVDGRDVPLHRTKDKALLAFLCTNRGRAFRREYLADLLWPKSNTEKARHCLTQALYSLRRIRPDLIVTDKGTVQCNDACLTTDIDGLLAGIRSKDALRILAHVKGPFLDDLALLDAEPFVEWREACHTEFFKRIEQALANVLNELPPQEANAQLIAIRRQWGDTFTMLQDRDGTLNFGSTTTSDEGRQLETLTKSLTNAANIPFVGRTNHIAELQRMLVACADDTTGWALISGNAGYGKTRLISELINRVPAEFRIIKVRCYESERRVGFGPIFDAFRSTLRPHDLANIEPVWRSALSYVLPLPLAGAVPLPPLSAQASRSRLFEALLRLFESLALSKPTVLCIDDLQWCDRSTSALLSYLTHRLKSARLLIIGSIRTLNVHQSLGAPWCEWRQFKLGELSEANIRTLLQDLRSQNRPVYYTCENITSLTGGHPYLISEILSASIPHATNDRIPNSISAGVDQFVSSLLRGLTKKQEYLLAVLAVLGRPSKVRLIARVARMTDVGRWLDPLVARGILTVNAGKAGFRHDLVREASYKKISALTREELHYRAATVQKTSTKRIGEVAEHFHKARKKKLAYDWALAAVTQADDVHAQDEAIYFTRLAITNSKKHSDSLKLLLAERLNRAHRLSEARDELSSLLANARSLTNSDRMLITILDLEIAVQVAKIDTKSALESLAALIIPAEPFPKLLHRVLRLQLRCAYHVGDARVISQSIEDLRHFAFANATREEAIDALALAARAHSSVHSAVDANKIGTELAERVDSVCNHELRIRVLTALGGIAYESGDITRSEAIHLRALSEIKCVGAMNMWPMVATVTHMLMVEQGKYANANGLREEIEALAHSVDDHYALAVLDGNTASMMYELGDFKGCEEYADRGRLSAERSNWVWIELGLTGLIGLCRIEQGDISGARAMADRGLSRLNQLPKRMADISYLEILIARITSMLKGRDAAVDRLSAAIADYSNREVICRLRMQLERANILKHSNKPFARREAKDVFEVARQANAFPLAERADRLIRRL
jgi:hypothetical protein